MAVLVIAHSEGGLLDSGVYACVTAALEIPACRVTAVDVSQKILETAKYNAEVQGVEERIQLRLGDIFCAKSARNAFFDPTDPPTQPPASRQPNFPRGGLTAGDPGGKGRGKGKDSGKGNNRRFHDSSRVVEG